MQKVPVRLWLDNGVSVAVKVVDRGWDRNLHENKLSPEFVGARFMHFAIEDFADDPADLAMITRAVVATVEDCLPNTKLLLVSITDTVTTSVGFVAQALAAVAADLREADGNRRFLLLQFNAVSTYFTINSRMPVIGFQEAAVPLREVFGLLGKPLVGLNQGISGKLTRVFSYIQLQHLVCRLRFLSTHSLGCSTHCNVLT